MALHSQLKDLLLLSGLSEIAVNVYMELLKKPAHTIWELVLRTGICKSSVYRAFEELMRLKMVEKNDKAVNFARSRGREDCFLSRRSLGLVGSQTSEAELKNKEWGEFFPAKYSLFPYNETLAQDFFPQRN